MYITKTPAAKLAIPNNMDFDIFICFLLIL
jgi:hypothetical protein